MPTVPVEERPLVEGKDYTVGAAVPGKSLELSIPGPKVAPLGGTAPSNAPKGASASDLQGTPAAPAKASDLQGTPVEAVPDADTYASMAGALPPSPGLMERLNNHLNAAALAVNQELYKVMAPLQAGAQPDTLPPEAQAMRAPVNTGATVSQDDQESLFDRMNQLSTLIRASGGDPTQDPLFKEAARAVAKLQQGVVEAGADTLIPSPSLAALAVKRGLGKVLPGTVLKNGKLARLEDGKIVPIGNLPTTQDMETARDIMGGGNQTLKVLKKLYHDHGIHPAEVVHDAQTDVTIYQDVRRGEIPEAYGGPVPEPNELPVEAGGRQKPTLGKGGEPPREPPKDAGSSSTSGSNLLGGPPREPMTEAEANRRMSKGVSLGGHDVKKWANPHGLYTALVDELHPVMQAERKAMKKLGLKVDDLADSTAYEDFRTLRGSFGRAVTFIKQGTRDFETWTPNGKSLEEVLAPVKNDMRDFINYINAKRADFYHKQGIETGFDPEAAAITARKVVPQSWATAQKELVDYQNRLTRYLRDSGVISHAAYQKMLEENPHYVPWYSAMSGDGQQVPYLGGGKSLGARNPIKEMSGHDIMTVDPIESIVKNTYAYLALAEKNGAGLKLVDLLKAADEGKIFTRDMLKWKEPTIRFRGAAEPSASEVPKGTAVEPLHGEVLPPLHERIESELGKVPAKTVEEPPILGSAKFGPAEDAKWETVPGAPVSHDFQVYIQTRAEVHKGGGLTVFRNGVKETYRSADQALVTAWQGLDRETANVIFRMLAVPAKLMRAGTVLSPQFMTKNLIRDFQQAVINTRGLIFSPVNTAKGLLGQLRKDDDYWNWMMGGGGNSAMVSLDRKYLQQNIENLHSTGILQKGWNTVTSPFEGLRMISGIIENSTRLGEYKKIAGGATDKATIKKGAFASREVHLDFARMGAQMHTYNMITAFANAHIQGVDRITRAFIDSPKRTTLRVLIGLSLPSVLNWAVNHSDPKSAARYDDLPDYERDLTWPIMFDNWKPVSRETPANLPWYMKRDGENGPEWNDGTTVKIPKDFAPGVFFGSGTERMLDAFYAHKPHAFDGFLGDLAGSVLPGMTPSFALPFVHQYANSTTFGGKIVTDAESKQLGPYQYNAFTSATAKVVGKYLGAFPGVENAQLSGNGFASVLSSPARIDALIRDTTGTLGQMMMAASDAGLKKAGLVPNPPLPVQKWSDNLFVKAFVVRYPSMNLQPIQDFHDNQAHSGEILATLEARLKMQDSFAVQELAARVKEDVPKLAAMSETIAKMSQLIDNTYRDPNQPSEDKSRVIGSAYWVILQTAKAGNATYEQMRANAAKAAAAPSDRIQHEDIGEQKTSWMDSIKNAIFGAPKSQYLGDASKMQSYPTAEEGQAALAAGIDYDKRQGADVRAGMTRDATGLHLRQDIQGDIDALAEALTKLRAKPNAQSAQLLGQAIVAVNRNPISALGFDPSKIAIEHSGHEMSTAGFYAHEQDVIWMGSATPSTITHESTHRGLQQLRDAGVLDQEEKDFLRAHEESAVRWIMMRDMGNPEQGRGPLGDRDIAAAKYIFQDSNGAPRYNKLLASIEDKAATLVAQRAPGHH